ncbi:MAG TPA: D-Ala-D-Ala carboxypeptidase family metallohydrolase [Acidimicrobiia bacterium]
MSRWRHFTAPEFACQGQDCCKGRLKMDPDFIDLLDEMRHRCGFPWVISSGYRCPAHNSRVSSTGPTGPHTTGRAVDVAVSRAQAHEVARVAFDMGMTGIGFRQHGNQRFVHLDNLTEADGYPRPTIWTYG